MDNQNDKNGFDLSIITISYDINSDLIRCLKSCRFLKISVEHILVFLKKKNNKLYYNLEINIKSILISLKEYIMLLI